MNAVPKITGPCEHCKQPRPLFRYEPEHNAHLGGGFATCRWCTREKQPLLCVRCWEKERLREENDPALNEEAETLEEICAANRRADERRERISKELAGIAAATERAEAER
ncbi:hypothetical protein [Streptomyces spinosisporus]|uniref:Uncharacterized protein n=1 Tax=Streptomyces spinosisporus TaxID=2927582 RepID=A0ABS9XWN4_9ACTN|nr:hypothetical protein [Streptomyces spinosisporus]MCI3246485.1 hypothetical protein [Streptomyces spinosisporus]